MTGRQDGNRLDFWTAAGLASVFLLIYWLGRSQSFGAGDSPQHVLSALTWGVSWPPGYPLYNGLGFMFSRLPFGTPESNVNGFSGLCHAGAVAVFFLALRRQGLDRLWAGFSAALMGLSPLFWYYSQVAEVRALNDLLAVLAVLLAQRWASRRDLLSLAAFAAVLGLGISHHPTYVLILPPLAYWLWSQNALPSKGRAALFALLAVAACALPYVALGVRLQVSPPIYNPMGVKTWQDVLGLFLRTNLGGPMRMVGGRGLFDPGGFQLAPLLSQGKWLLQALWSEPGPLGLLLAAAGAFALARRARKLAVFWGLWFFLDLGCVLFLSSQQLHPHDPDYARAIAMRFYLMPFFSVFACAGFGARLLGSRRPKLGALAAAAAVAALASRPVILRGRDPVLRYGEDILASSAPGDMILLASDDAVLVMNYLDYIGRRAEGRVFLNPVLFAFKPYLRDLKARYPDLNFPPISESGLSTDWHQWLRRNPGRKLYSEAMFLQVLARDFRGLAPHGVLIEASDRPADRERLKAEAASFLASSSLSRLSRRDVFPWTQEVYLAKTAALLLAWYGSLVDSKGNEALVADIRARLAALE